MFANDEASSHPMLGKNGPEWKGELLKQSAHIGKWSDRYFILKGRKLWYYETQGDARPARGKPNGEPKGYYDCEGATFSMFEEEDEGECFFGFELAEVRRVLGLVSSPTMRLQWPPALTSVSTPGLARD